MKKPIIKIYRYNGCYVYVCDYANSRYGSSLNHIDAIFYVLKIAYLCRKDVDGNYLLAGDLIHPIFD